MVELERKAEASGELLVEMPAMHRVRFSDARTGDEVVLEHPHPSRWRHPSVRLLARLQRELLDVALEHSNPEAAALGHIVRALCVAIEKNDLDSLNAPEGPHTWARRYLRENGNGGEGEMLPVEDSRGRLLPMAKLSGGFRRLAAIIQWSIESTRPRGMALDSFPFLGRIAAVMAWSFPSVQTLAGPDPGRDEKAWQRIEDIASRISHPLRLLGDQRRNEPAETLAQDIAQELLEIELRRSLKTDTEIREAFRFRNAHRDSH